MLAVALLLGITAVDYAFSRASMWNKPLQKSEDYVLYEHTRTRAIKSVSVEKLNQMLYDHHNYLPSPKKDDHAAD